MLLYYSLKPASVESTSSKVREVLEISGLIPTFSLGIRMAASSYLLDQQLFFCQRYRIYIPTYLETLEFNIALVL
jgi:hypothetical protein